MLSWPARTYSAQNVGLLAFQNHHFDNLDTRTQSEWAWRTIFKAELAEVAQVGVGAWGKTYEAVAKAVDVQVDSALFNMEQRAGDKIE